MAYVNVVWNTEDVLSVADDLTGAQADAVLLLAGMAQHDANQGVNWDVLAYWANEVRNNPELAERTLENWGQYLHQDKAAA
jgi:hypothetical protein